MLLCERTFEASYKVIIAFTSSLISHPHISVAWLSVYSRHTHKHTHIILWKMQKEKVDISLRISRFVYHCPQNLYTDTILRNPTHSVDIVLSFDCRCQRYYPSIVFLTACPHQGHKGAGYDFLYNKDWSPAKFMVHIERSIIETRWLFRVFSRPSFWNP